MHYYSKENLELMADEINRKYYPERLSKMIPFDHYDYMENVLHLDVEWKYLSPNMKILGLIFFEDGEFYVWPKGTFSKKDVPVKEFFKKGTVVINQAIIDKKDLEKERFVANHENMHWVKDIPFFSKIDNSILQICNKDSFSSTNWNEERISTIDIVERQTNYLNAAVLMPRDVIIKEFLKAIRFTFVPTKPLEIKKWMYGAISKIAKAYGVNFNVVKYRLQDLEVLEREKRYNKNS